LKEHFTRTADTVALCGFAPSSRELVPWDNPDVEIWCLNEAANFPWTKRIDRLFQIHPRWDITRDNNANDWNHWSWLKYQKAPCNLCQGTGKLKVEDKDIDCTANGCEDGTYVPLSNRLGVKTIYTADTYKDVPNSVKYPLKQAIKYLGQKYFTSSFGYMLVLAVMMGFKRIECYGFDMGSGTEYHYQRPNAEYLVGWARGRGIDVYIPAQSPMASGPLYAYENMRTGYRQQMDMRLAVLNVQLETRKNEQLVAQGRLQMATDAGLESAQEENAKYNRANAMVNFMKGAITETENLIALYDTYFITGADGEQTVYRADMDNHVGVQYA
jgi:hypothetical protein